MDLIMTVVAYAITLGMLGGAIGGWLIFLIALINDLRTSGKFEMISRRRPSLRLPALRRLRAR